MSDEPHKAKLLSRFTRPPKSTDDLPLSPRCKLILYQRNVLFKVSLNLIAKDLTLTWANENIDNTVSKSIRQ